MLEGLRRNASMDYPLSCKSKFPQKALILSEAGAGGIFGRHGDKYQKWLFAGFAICEILVDPKYKSASRRPGPRWPQQQGLGLLSLDIRPKLAYHAHSFTLKSGCERSSGDFPDFPTPAYLGERGHGELWSSSGVRFQFCYAPQT
eukprot:4756983-Amphidinium_carterae.2